MGVIESALLPLGDHLWCDICRSNLKERVEGLVKDWSGVKVCSSSCSLLVRRLSSSSIARLVGHCPWLLNVESFTSLLYAILYLMDANASFSFRRRSEGVD